MPLRDSDTADPAAFVAEMLRRNLIRRTCCQKGLVSLHDLENIERRAGNVWKELCMVPRFDHVIPTHDGEDSENWEAFAIPVGDARRTTIALKRIIEGAGDDSSVDTFPEWLFS